MNKYFVEFVGTLFFLYVVLATGNAIAIGIALVIAIMLGAKISGGYWVIICKFVINTFSHYPLLIPRYYWIILG